MNTCGNVQELIPEIVFVSFDVAEVEMSNIEHRFSTRDALGSLRKINGKDSDSMSTFLATFAGLGELSILLSEQAAEVQRRTPKS